MDQQRFGPESAAVRRSSDGHCEARAHAREQKLRQDKEHTQSVDISEEFKQQIARLIELQEEAAESGYQGLQNFWSLHLWPDRGDSYTRASPRRDDPA